MDAEAHELIAGYALDALEPADRARAKELLERSEEAREELRALRETTAAMATAVSGPAPPPGLRERVLGVGPGRSADGRPARVTSPPVGSPRSSASPPPSRPSSPSRSGSGASPSRRDLDESRAALAQARAAAAVLASPDARTVGLAQGDGSLVVSGEEAVLVLNGMQGAPAGKTYEVWVLDGQTPVRAGLFAGGRGRDVVPVEATVGPGAKVARDPRAVRRRRRADDEPGRRLECGLTLAARSGIPLPRNPAARSPPPAGHIPEGGGFAAAAGLGRPAA